MNAEAADDITADAALAVVLLAAGGARRYGRAKLVEPTAGGGTLVRGAARAALAVSARVIVVTGAHREAVAAALEELPLRVLDNADWSLGIGHSIALAFRTLLDEPRPPSAALLCLADQPQVGAPQLRRLIEAAVTSPERIIVSDYGAQRGPPCLFPARYFAELAGLSGDTGARSLLRQHAEQVKAIAMPEAALDIDTPDDYARWRGGAP